MNTHGMAAPFFIFCMQLYLQKQITILILLGKITRNLALDNFRKKNASKRADTHMDNIKDIAKRHGCSETKINGKRLCLKDVYQRDGSTLSGC